MKRTLRSTVCWSFNVMLKHALIPPPVLEATVVRSPIKQLPKRARTGDVVYSAELMQSKPVFIRSPPTFTRPSEGVKTETQAASPATISPLIPTRRVFYAPGEVIPAF